MSKQSTMVKNTKRKAAAIGRSVSAPFARATASLRMLPDFLIVGAQRAGTTSLYNYLVQHPDVGRVRLGKGVHYFDTNPTASLGWYRSHFPLDPAKVPLKKGPRSVGEGAPYYMFHPMVPERIDAALPNVKLIAILLAAWGLASACAPESVDRYQTGETNEEIVSLLNNREYGKAVWLIENRALVNVLVHPDYVDPHRLHVYGQLLDHLQAQAGGWHALPCEVASWWRTRVALERSVAGSIPSALPDSVTVAHAVLVGERIEIEA